MGLIGFTLSASPRYPAGTVIGAYPRKLFPGPRPQDGQSTVKTPVATATVGTDGRAVFPPQLEEETAYYAGAQVAGVWTWTDFRTPEVTSVILGEQVRAEAAEKRLEELIKELGGGTPGSPSGSPGAPKLLFGINSNSSKGHAATWTGSRVYGDRSDKLDVNFASSPEEASASVAASLAAGCRPMLVINTNDSEVLGKVNAATYAAGALAIIERIIRDHPTVTVFQLVNEPYYKGSSPHGSKVGSNGTVYGEIVKATYEKVRAAGLLTRVTLLVEAFGQYNSFADLVHEEKQEQSGAFKHWVKDVCLALKDPVGLAVGDSTTTYAVADQTLVGHEEAFQFTARKSAAVKDLRFRTNAVANPGVSSVVLGIAADEAGKPGAILGQATFTGEPAPSSWIAATLPATVNVVSGTKYWLIVLPLGTAGKLLHFNAAVASGGTGNVEAKPSGLTAITQEAAGEWETFNQGPVGFQAGVELGASLASEINGWSNHPYGTLGAANGEGNFNWGSTEGFRKEVEEQGAGGNNNWWLTEFGWQGEATQNERMQGFLEKALAAHEAGWLTAIFEYDDGDAEWSIWAKPAGETLRNFAALHG